MGETYLMDYKLSIFGVNFVRNFPHSVMFNLLLFFVNSLIKLKLFGQGKTMEASQDIFRIFLPATKMFDGIS